MFNWLLNLLGLQRIPPNPQGNLPAPVEDEPLRNPWDPKLFKMSHRRRFENTVSKLIKVVEAVNSESFSNYVINVGGHRFVFKHSTWTDFTVDVPDAWLVRSKLGDRLEYNVLRLDDDEHENWWRLANAAEAAIEEVKRRDQELQARTAMEAIMR